MHRKLASPPPLRLLYGLPWLAAAGAVSAALCLRTATVNALAGGVLAASVLAFGLPHGAADWWVMRLAAGERWTHRGRAVLVGGYVLAAALTLAFWRWRPALALEGFLVLTAWHFGSADASTLLPPGKRGAAWWLFALGRGGLVIGTPLAFRPAESAALLQPFAALSGEPGAMVTAEILRAAWPLVWIGAALQTVALRIEAHHQPGGRTRDPGLTCNFLETAVLLALFRLAPPLWAFACYWVAFHAWRHVWRIEARLHPGLAVPPGRALVDFHRRTLPLTLLSLAGLVGIFALWPALTVGAAGWRTAYFVLLSALTVPHAIVTGWLDATD